MATIQRRAYAEMFGPTTGDLDDQLPAALTALVAEAHERGLVYVPAARTQEQHHVDRRPARGEA